MTTRDALSVTEARDAAGTRRDWAGYENDQAGDKRDHVGDVRDLVGDQRDLLADRRDEAGDRRDQAADQRDDLADKRDPSGWFLDIARGLRACSRRAERSRRCSPQLTGRAVRGVQRGGDVSTTQGEPHRTRPASCACVSRRASTSWRCRRRTGPSP